jgi:hypothetical protein
MKINIQPLVHKLELLEQVKEGTLSILCWLGIHEWSIWGEWRNFYPLNKLDHYWQQEREKMCWWCDAVKREYRTVVLKY